MKFSSKKRMSIIFSHLRPVVYGLAGFVTPVGAQNADAPVVSQSGSIAALATQGADSVTDDELSNRVKAALHSDPYFYDEHVSVSVENGVVVLRGFVFSDWDLRDAIRIAGQAADGRRVVDNLWIKLGGRS